MTYRGTPAHWMRDEYEQIWVQWIRYWHSGTPHDGTMAHSPVASCTSLAAFFAMLAAALLIRCTWRKGEWERKGRGGERGRGESTKGKHISSAVKNIEIILVSVCLCLFICLFVYLFVYLFVCLFVCFLLYTAKNVFLFTILLYLYCFHYNTPTYWVYPLIIIILL